MFNKIRLHIEFSSAIFTPILLDLAVGLHVGPQVGSVRKSFAALGAAERFFSGVGSHVALQQPGTGECLVTNCTFVGQVMG